MSRNRFVLTFQVIRPLQPILTDAYLLIWTLSNEDLSAALLWITKNQPACLRSLARSSKDRKQLLFRFYWLKAGMVNGITIALARILGIAALILFNALLQISFNYDTQLLHIKQNVLSFGIIELHLPNSDWVWLWEKVPSGHIYCKTSMARTRMARLPWMIRTLFSVPTKYFH